jgi:hypothetical protein
MVNRVTNRVSEDGKNTGQYPSLQWGASPETACFFYSRLIVPILILCPIIGQISIS